MNYLRSAFIALGVMIVTFFICNVHASRIYAVDCCSSADCSPGQSCSGADCNNPYGITYGICVGGGGCTGNADCPGCQSCNVSTGQCYDDNGWCASCSTCSGGSCSVPSCPVTCGAPGTCGTIAGCNCYESPDSCGGPCTGYVECPGGGTCADGTTVYRNFCTPACGSGQCYKTPSCTETDCRIVGCGGSTPDCGVPTNPSCAKIVCAGGGNCLSDCTSCVYPSPTPGGACDAGCGACGYRNPNGTCGSQGVCCNEPPVSPTPPSSVSKTCSITSVSSQLVYDGTSMTIGYSGRNTSTGGNELVRLWVEKWPDIGEITPTPGSPWPLPPSMPQYYQIANCTSSGTNACTGSATITLPIGSYYAHCDLPNDPNKCSGNPYCSYEGKGGVSNCSGWVSCSAPGVGNTYGDNVFLKVDCDPNNWGAGWSSCSLNVSNNTSFRTRTNACGLEELQNCTGTINAKAVKVNSSTADCTTINSSPDGIDGATIRFTLQPQGQSATGVQSGNTAVALSNILGGMYQIRPTVPSNYNIVTGCWAKTNNSLSSATSLTAPLSLTEYGDIMTWNVGYTLGQAWVQTVSGLVHANTDLQSKIPDGTPQPVFNKDESSGYPGLVTYGSSYNFTAHVGNTGEDRISSKTWLAQQTHTAIDLYTYFYNKLGAPTVYDYSGSEPDINKPTSRTTPYYVDGSMAAHVIGSWSVGSNETYIFLVNGNLNLDVPITVQKGGFLAFVVKGTITVGSGVGGTYASVTPVVQGVYIAGDTIAVPIGADNAHARLVGKGMFIANNFTLQRDLIAVGQNVDYASEYFIYDPDLFMAMPDNFKDIPLTWQEVAP